MINYTSVFTRAKIYLIRTQILDPRRKDMYWPIISCAPNFREKIFADRPLTNFRAKINLVNQGFPLATPSFSGRIHYLCSVATTPCSAACFRIQALLLIGEPRLGLSWFVCLSSSRRRLPIDQETYDGGPHESGSVRFETIECHVTLGKFSRKDSRGLISSRYGTISAKTTKIMRFKITSYK